MATPSKGFHLYFTATGHQVRNSAGCLGQLIDIRADGGYVIGPGSQVNGHAYRPHNAFPAAPLPQWIAAALEKPPTEPVPRPPSACWGGPACGGHSPAASASRSSCSMPPPLGKKMSSSQPAAA